jgi:small redox-active disulfide protein 2
MILNGGDMKLEVLGSGCRKCIELEKRVREAISILGLKAEVVHIYDISRMVEMGVAATPALLLDGKVILSGILPTTEYLVSIIRSKAG